MKNPEVLIPKLDSLARCLGRIRSKMPFSSEVLSKDADLQDIISVNLERAIQQCVDIASVVIAEVGAAPPSTMSEDFKTLAKEEWISVEMASLMNRTVGFRNILVHEYQKVDWAIAHAICTKHLDELAAFGRVVSEKANL